VPISAEPTTRVQRVPHASVAVAARASVVAPRSAVEWSRVAIPCGSGFRHRTLADRHDLGLLQRSGTPPRSVELPSAWPNAERNWECEWQCREPSCAGKV